MKRVRRKDKRKKCKRCGSSLKRRWWVWPVGCINSECTNYYGRKG